MLTEVTVATLEQIVESVFATMMDLDVSVNDTPWSPDLHRLTSFVLMTGAWTGAVLIECSRWQACQFAGRILAMDPPDTVDDDVLDVLGELANMIGGNLKSVMRTGVHLSMPSVMDGSDHGLRICGLKVQERLALECADGPFWVSVLSKERKRVATWDGVERRRLSEATNRIDEQAEKHTASADENVWVKIALLEKLADLVAQLARTRDEILEVTAERDDAVLNDLTRRMGLISRELQEGMMKTCMQPIGGVWNKFPQMVRDMAIVLGKGVQLEMHGADTQVHQTVIEALKSPLECLVRNSCDHGIEPPQIRMRAGKLAQGFLTLRAYHDGDHVTIEVDDDGSGIDTALVRQTAVESGLLESEEAEKLSDGDVLNLILEPGYITAEKIANLSGQAMGIAVVKSQIENIGGVVEVFSQIGKGTIVRITVPAAGRSEERTRPASMRII
jgi:CheY-specific phosphatase CheX